jgi:hypothetical protein
MLAWIGRMRHAYLKGNLSPELVLDYKARGFEFCAAKARAQEQDKRWNKFYQQLILFRDEFGHVNVPSGYVENPDLGDWLRQQRERMDRDGGKLAVDKAEKLRKLGIMEFRESDGTSKPAVHMSPWIRSYKKLVQYLEENFDGVIPSGSVPRFSLELTTWLSRQRSNLEGGKLDPWQIEKLDAICFNVEDLPRAAMGPSIKSIWPERLARMAAFCVAYGHGNVPARYAKDPKLASFVQLTRSRYRKGLLSPEKIEQLIAVGFTFEAKQMPTEAWLNNHAQLLAFYQQHGHSNVPRDYQPNQAMAEHAAQQKQRARKGKLLREHIRMLDEIKFEWSDGHPAPKD